MSRSFRKFPRNKYNRSHMKKIFNRGLRRKINHGLLDDCLLAGNEYRKVYSRYDISEGYALYPLYRAIQPVIKVEIPVIFYNTVGFDEKNNLIYSEEWKETGIVSYKKNTKYFNFPTVFRSKNPYSKKSIEHERFENWQKTVVRK